ncbi:hypothetical protein EDD18DRAFT_1115848 [Armillaria luteobubalina]|uniref:Uncharacterized protein n=1 Tax=Armillaria luteobubalina TaxID=153913 RepID=A0AA39TAE9_9AGAR|nr:hypothetical protein EDD18DRAFT_1115848 [Armillaria luteobubalina]
MPSDASEGEPRPRTAHISQHHGPEVEKLTSHYQPRRRKTRRRTMGMERTEYINKGNDPFDYEKKFPEDKQGEELGAAARVWRTCLEECAASDSEMVEGWRDRWSGCSPRFLRQHLTLTLRDKQSASIPPRLKMKPEPEAQIKKKKEWREKTRKTPVLHTSAPLIDESPSLAVHSTGHLPPRLKVKGTTVLLLTAYVEYRDARDTK